MPYDSRPSSLLLQGQSCLPPVPSGRSRGGLPMCRSSARTMSFHLPAAGALLLRALQHHQTCSRSRRQVTTGGQGLPSAFSIVSTMNPSIPYWWEGSSIVIADTFSAPAPFGSTVTVNFSPGWTWIAGMPGPVLSPVLCRESGSTTLGRNGISRVARRTPSATPSYRSAGQWHIGREREVHDRDTGVLAHRHAQPLCLPNIFQDIGKLTACHRVCLGSGGLPDHPQVHPAGGG